MTKTQSMITINLLEATIRSQTVVIKRLESELQNEWIPVDGHEDLPLGTWLVNIPDEKEMEFQVAFVHKNATLIGHSFAFDVKRVVAYKSLRV